MTTTDTEVMMARRHDLGSLLERTAARRPDHLAIVWREKRETYAEFDTAVNRAANRLMESGVTKGDRIAVFAHNSREFILVYFALAKLGAISVPINFMLKAPDVAFILAHAGVMGIVVEDALAPVAIEAMRLDGNEEVVGVRGWMSIGGTAAPDGWEDVASWEAYGDASAPGVEIADDDPLQLLYTSGTESRPKGVMISSRSLMTQYVSCIVDGGMGDDDVEIHALPFYHCAQLHCFFTPDVYLGATSVILPGPDPALILRTIERERITKLFCPPTVWIGLLRSPAFAEHDLSSLRKGYYGASPMPVEVLKEMQQRLPDVDLWNFYGQTEMAPLATILKPHEQLDRLGSAGKPAINVETRLVDDDDEPVPQGAIGEIVHRSPHATLGYWHDPEKTAEAFRTGWFHSGDLGVMDGDGYVTVVDRKKDMIKTGGENVASREVEEALFEMTGVEEVAVFGVRHPYWVEAVVAVVVPKAGASLTSEAILEFAHQRLSGFKAPKYVVFADRLPKNPSGKILKRDLRDEYEELAGDT